MAAYVNAYDVKNEADYKFGYDFILEGILDRIKAQLEEMNIAYEKTDINQIYDFLAPLVDGKVWISFEKEIPEIRGYSYNSIALGIHTLQLAYGDNIVQSRFPNALYVTVSTDYEKKFREFWRIKYLPTCILEEAISHLDLTKTVIVHVFETVYHWRGYLVNAKNPIVIGQDINSKDFKSYRPVGYIDNNILVLTSPNDRNDPTGVVYHFN